MQKNKNKYIIAVITVVSTIILILYIGHTIFTQKKSEDMIGVIETSAVESSSSINVYSTDGKLKKKLDLNIADVNSGFINPVIDNDNIYINSLGTYSDESRKIIDYNFLNNQYSTYDIAYGVISMAKYKNFICTTNSPPKNSIITKYDMDKKEIINSIKLPSFITHINVLNEMLYAFGISDSNNNLSEMYIININSMEIIKKIELKNKKLQLDSISVDSDIYFSSQYDETDNENCILTKYNIDKDELIDIKLPIGHLNQLKKNDDFLFISHYDPIKKEGNTISVLNLKDNSLTKLNFDHTINKFEIKKNNLIILDDTCVYVYKFEDLNVNLISKFNVKNNDNTHYLSGLFINKVKTIEK